jgi:hypothetical protein
MQGPDQTVIGLSHDLAHFKQLKLWKRKMEEKKIGCFMILNLLLEENKFVKFLKYKLLLLKACEN